jgi:hypothetical protein
LILTKAVQFSLETLELKEVYTMFAENNMPLPFESLKQLFHIVGQKPGSITLEEFKKFSLSEHAKNSMPLNRLQRCHENAIQ